MASCEPYLIWDFYNGNQNNMLPRQGSHCRSHLSLRLPRAPSKAHISMLSRDIAMRGGWLILELQIEKQQLSRKKQQHSHEERTTKRKRGRKSEQDERETENARPSRKNIWHKDTRYISAIPTRGSSRPTLLISSTNHYSKRRLVADELGSNKLEF